MTYEFHKIFTLNLATPNAHLLSINFKICLKVLMQKFTAVIVWAVMQCQCNAAKRGHRCSLGDCLCGDFKSIHFFVNDGVVIIWEVAHVRGRIFRCKEAAYFGNTSGCLP